MSLGILMLAGVALAQPQGFGVGVILGEPTGVTVAWRQDPWRAVQAGVGYDFVRGRFDVNADYLRSIWVPWPAADVRFPIYVGLGADLETASRGDSLGDVGGLGVRVPLGAALHYDVIPTELFVQGVPTLRLLPHPAFGMDVSIGGRLYF